MTEIKMFLQEKEIIPYDHPGIKQTIHCPLCGELMTLLRYKNPNGRLPFVTRSQTMSKYPMACIDCKKFYFFGSSPLQLKEIPEMWEYRFKEIKRLKWEEKNL